MPHVGYCNHCIKPDGGYVLEEKVAYVKAQPQTRAHTCHWPKCGKHVPPAMWGCKTHWFKLPARLRSAIWLTYKPEQEINMTPSGNYIAAANAVQQWINTSLRVD